MLHKLAFGSNINCSDYCPLNWMHILHILSTDSQIAAQSSFFAFNLLNSTKIYSFIFKTWPQYLHYLSLAFCCTPQEKIARASLGDLGGNWDDQRRPVHIGKFFIGKTKNVTLKLRFNPTCRNTTLLRSLLSLWGHCLCSTAR